ncbi:Short-chain dehydrogenase/reductase SDR [Candidatus Sulfopaludibacter sp. SbA4]|nr:Short-chain dehydrogenase/reductase SDR [Candidatus Sulfopaludibacter sp. SbA4]
MESLSGKIAIVTGGTRGIGRAIAERLLREGAWVAICGRSQESVDRAVAQMKALGRLFGHPADVSDSGEVHRFFQAVDSEFGGLDILVNNAGAGVFRKVGDMTPEEWHRNIDLNLNGPFYCSREALPRFAQRGGGFIVNISSLAGKNAFSGGAAYNASKSGLNLFTEALMLDHRHDNVRVSSIMPGSVDTEFGADSGFRAADSSWMIAPEDVAEAVDMVLRMPARTMISRVEMRPSRPKK